MIQEEENICHTHESSSLNKRLFKGMEELKTKYDEQLNTIKSNRENFVLTKIYDLMESVSDKSMVKIQLDAVRRHQQLLVENNQRFGYVNAAR
jgi:hypothetical protein